MIRVRFHSQLGNQLFQYCIGRIVSERTGQPYRPDPGWLNKAGRPITWSGPPCLPPPALAAGRLVGGAPQYFKIQNWIDLKAIDRSRPVRMEGYFQRYELFKHYKKQIRTDWLKLQTPFVATDPEAVYIHVRRTDYVGEHLNPDKQCQATSLDDYEAGLKEFPGARKIILVSDNYADPFLDGFAKLGLPVERAGGTWDQDFMLLASCRNMIMSQSTYAWWAAFLGRTEKIVCPMPASGFWGRGVGLLGAPKAGGRDYVNLFVDDEPERWKWVVT